MGVWDAQKMTVADTVPGVMHVDLTVADVNNWYKVDSDQEGEDITLISADGIHPNARCYKKWGEFVGNSLADQIIGSMAHKMNQDQNFGVQDRLPAYGGAFHIPSAFGVAKQHQ